VIDLNIESVVRFNEIACYGRVWLVEFRDYQQVIVLENNDSDICGEIEGNFVIEQEES